MSRSVAGASAVKPPSDEVILVATIEEVLFRSTDGHFVVTRVLREQRGGTDEERAAIAVGDLGAVAPGETLRLRGRWTRHAVHGLQFQVSAFTPVMPTSPGGVIRYLGSGLVAGIGPAIAERLVARFGAATLDVIATQSARLREVKGIGRRRADAIAKAVRDRRDEAETLSFLQSLGVGPAVARRIRTRYGDAAPRIVREDPYLVAEEVPGVGFRTADRIGLACGIGRDDARRAAGAVLHLLGRGADEGQVFLTRDELRAGARTLDVPEARIDDAVETLSGRGMVVLDDAAVYAPPLHRAEVFVAQALVRLARPRSLGAAGVPVVHDGGIELAPAQAEAVRVSLDHGLVVLTGGPGTGKTTTVRAIVRAHASIGRRVVLCAPTGRAAKRLNEATGAEARTIHRLLEWNPITGRFARDERSPIEADLVLVDEASMLDVMLADKLLRAISPASTLVLVGDVEQLPPVSPGQVLRDLLASGAAAVVRLTQVFRQAQRSAIVRGAHEILAGHAPVPTAPGTRGEGDLFVVRARDADVIVTRTVEALRRIERAYGFDLRRDVQVLVPMRRGTVGTERLNEILQAELNPPRADAGSAVNANRLRAGDKVMQLRNDYERDVFNGDLGEVRRVEGGVTFVEIDGREIQYRIDDLDALALAYASTIHKAQGSEFRAVVLVLAAAHHVLLTRALLYTAVTRAKKLVVIVGDDRAVARAARNASSYRANSRLVDRIRQHTGDPPRAG